MNTAEICDFRLVLLATIGRRLEYLWGPRDAVAGGCGRDKPGLRATLYLT